VVLRSVVSEYWPSLLAFAIFGGLHSVCAQDGFKTRLARWTSPFVVDHFWRFPYCALSYLALYHGVAVLHWGWHPAANVWLFAYPTWLWDGLVVVHLGSIGVMYTAFAQSDYLEFWGLRQLWHGLRALRAQSRSPGPLELFGTHRLVVRGIYRWIRHPMLIGGFLFLVTSGPSKNNVVFTGMYATYMLLGAYIEERRLLRIFGDTYRRYRREVGAFFPRLRVKPNARIG